jgi:hypothetical protein
MRTLKHSGRDPDGIRLILVALPVGHALRRDPWP